MATNNSCNYNPTNHAVQVGGASGALTSLSVGADHSLLIGSTGADPSFVTNGTPYVSSISFDSGTNSLDNYTNAGTWTPTVVGAVAGTTNYTTQAGRYVRIGNLVWATATIVITSATGTGQAQFSLPIAVRSVANVNAFGSIVINGTGWALPVTTTYPVLAGVGGTSIAVVQCAGNAIAASNLQMANAACTFGFSITYYV